MTQVTQDRPTNPFTRHPESVGESYLQHACVAARFAGLLSLAASAALVHAVFPFLCETTASRMISQLNAEMQSRHK